MYGLEMSTEVVYDTLKAYVMSGLSPRGSVIMARWARYFHDFLVRLQTAGLFRRAVPAEFLHAFESESDLMNDREAKEVRLKLMEEGIMIHEETDADDDGHTYLLGSVWTPGNLPDPWGQEVICTLPLFGVHVLLHTYNVRTETTSNLNGDNPNEDQMNLFE